jgi:hypothetical protein
MRCVREFKVSEWPLGRELGSLKPLEGALHSLTHSLARSLAAAMAMACPSSLLELVRAGDAEACARLLAREGAGGGVHDANEAGEGPLHFAAGFGNTALVTLLLESGADALAPDKSGLTPLMCAVAKGHVLTAEVLLTVGGSRLEAGDLRGQTALHYAAAVGWVDCVRVLINYGADANARSNSGLTPQDMIHSSIPLMKRKRIEEILGAAASDEPFIPATLGPARSARRPSPAQAPLPPAGGHSRGRQRTSQAGARMIAKLGACRLDKSQMGNSQPVLGTIGLVGSSNKLSDLLRQKAQHVREALLA